METPSSAPNMEEKERIGQKLENFRNPHSIPKRHLCCDQPKMLDT
jgi:hypothetical protein